MKLTAFKYGETYLPGNMAFKNGSDSEKLSISLMFFLIETENRKILVDVGCDTMPGFELCKFKKPVEVLEDYGIGRGEITDVLITHAHQDHIDAVGYYRDAKIYIEKAEYEEGAEYLKNNNNICQFREEAKIAEGITMKCIGGHSKGSCIVLINCNSRIYALCGDECYTKENLQLKKPTNTSFCPQKSAEFIEEYSKPCYEPIIFHDPDLVCEIGGRVIFDV